MAAVAARRGVQYPYFVARNTRGSLPVYSDWRNARTRYIVEIRAVQGDATALKADLHASLFHDKEFAQRMKIDIVRGTHLKLTAIPHHSKSTVFDWLTARGF